MLYTTLAPTSSAPLAFSICSDHGKTVDCLLRDLGRLKGKAGDGYDMLSEEGRVKLPSTMGAPRHAEVTPARAALELRWTYTRHSCVETSNGRQSPPPWSPTNERPHNVVPSDPGPADVGDPGTSGEIPAKGNTGWSSS